jgi:RHS repeat-associated protein
MNGQNLTKAYIPLPGGATAVYNSSGLAYFRHQDWLGSSRLASTPSRTIYYDGAYLPFGDSYAEMGTTDRSFTGQDEDTVQGLADFMFREYSDQQQGRWISPDPAGLKAVNPMNPQTWNRYAYVANNPLSVTDPSGLIRCPYHMGGIYNFGKGFYCNGWGLEGYQEDAWTGSTTNMFGAPWTCVVDGSETSCSNFANMLVAGLLVNAIVTWQEEIRDNNGNPLGTDQGGSNQGPVFYADTLATQYFFGCGTCWEFGAGAYVTQKLGSAALMATGMGAGEDALLLTQMDDPQIIWGQYVFDAGADAGHNVPGYFADYILNEGFLYTESSIDGYTAYAVPGELSGAEGYYSIGGYWNEATGDFYVTHYSFEGLP